MSAAAPSKAGGLKLGAEPRKVAILAVLLAVAAALLIYNLGSGSSGPSTPATAGTHSAAAPVVRGEVEHPRKPPPVRGRAHAVAHREDDDLDPPALRRQRRRLPTNEARIGA